MYPAGVELIPAEGVDRRTGRNEEGNGRFSEFFSCTLKKGNYLTRLLIECLLCDVL